jgi:hypothetical protein
MVGTYIQSNGNPLGWISIGGVVQTVHPPSNSGTPPGASAVTAINDSGQALVSANYIGFPNYTLGYVYETQAGVYSPIPLGEYTALNCSPGILATFNGLNNKSDVAGTCLKSGGISTDIVLLNDTAGSGVVDAAPTPAAPSTFQVTGVNDSNVIIGQSSNNPPYAAPSITFLISPTAAATTVSASGGANFYLTGINNSGTMVGTYQDTAGVYHGVLVTPAPVPSISSLTPNSLDAGSSAFTLTVNGSQFVNGDTVEWNDVSLATTYVSASKLTARVSAAEVAAAGSAVVRVVGAAAGNVASEPALFTIPLTSIVINSQTIKTVSGGYSITLALRNSGFKPATNISLTGAYLATSETSTALPLDIASIAAGGTKTLTLSFPADTGKTGEEEYLLLYGSYVGGGISLNSIETLP